MVIVKNDTGKQREWREKEVNPTRIWLVGMLPPFSVQIQVYIT